MANTDWRQTRDEIIEAALRKLGAIPGGGSATDAQKADGADALNGLVKAFQNIGVQLWAVEWTTQNLTAGKVLYSPDPILDIVKAFVRRSGTDYPVQVISMQQYFEIEDKDDSSLPIYLAFQTATANPEYYLWPVPDSSTDVLHYLQVKRLKDFDAGTDYPDFSSRWIPALVWGLASELAPEYGIPVDQQMLLMERAKMHLQQVIYRDRETQRTSDFTRSAY